MSAASRADVRCLYLDLDGTLLGRGASLLHDGEGRVTIDGVRAVQACLRAGVEVVLMSGRRRAQVFEDARLLGQSSFIFEAGACVVLDGEEHWLTGELLPGELTIAEQIERSGAPALLLERYRGRLEYHEPWHLEREVSHLFRGLVDVARGRPRCWSSTVTRTCGWWTTASSAGARRRSPTLPHVRGYHLVPAGASKAAAVALPPPRARLRARADLRRGRLARGSRLRRRGRRLLAGRQRARARSLDPRGDRRPRQRARGRGGPRAGVYEAVVSTLVGGSSA